MTNAWTQHFLREVAAEKGLTPKQTVIFLLKHGKDLGYREIEDLYNIKQGAAKKRMGEVYKRFELSGDFKGKRERLDIELSRLYQLRRKNGHLDSVLSSARESLAYREPVSPVNLYGDHAKELLDSNSQERNDCLPAVNTRVNIPIEGVENLDRSYAIRLILALIEPLDESCIVRLILALIELSKTESRSGKQLSFDDIEKFLVYTSEVDRSEDI